MILKWLMIILGVGTFDLRTVSKLGEFDLVQVLDWISIRRGVVTALFGLEATMESVTSLG